MGTLFDTSFLIDLERRGASLPEGEDLAIAAITAAELLHGVHRADRAHRARREAFVEAVLRDIPVIPFSLEVARTHARLWAELAGTPRLRGPHDLLVAATAVTLGWSLATLNRRHFEGVPGVQLSDLP